MAAETAAIPRSGSTKTLTACRFPGVAGIAPASSSGRTISFRSTLGTLMHLSHICLF
jgi:hypothetical protein